MHTYHINDKTLGYNVIYEGNEGKICFAALQVNKFTSSSKPFGDLTEQINRGGKEFSFLLGQV